ncbi:MAG: hypothetical protein FWF81_10845 [Defluviitaleaceae bacterium]|nr:hypothetical protein [Defluviitaleaceae bacterium]
MKKLILAISVVAFIVSINPNAVIALSNHQNQMWVEGDVSVNNVQGIIQPSERDINGRFVPIQRNHTNIYSNSVNNSFGVVGTLSSQAFFDLSTTDLLSFGPVFTRVENGPAAFFGIPPQLQLITSRPIPTIGRIIIDSTFITLAGVGTLSHNYHVYHTGQYAFSITSWSS